MDDGGDYAILNADQRIIGEAICRISPLTFIDAQDNARLWAAAPDLLAACELGLELLDTLREDEGIGRLLAPGKKDLYRGISEQMRDAIAKARGES